MLRLDFASLAVSQGSQTPKSGRRDGAQNCMPLHGQDVRAPHPGLQDAERMLDLSASYRHCLWYGLESVSGPVGDVLMLPSPHAALLARRATGLRWTIATFIAELDAHVPAIVNAHEAKR